MAAGADAFEINLHRGGGEAFGQRAAAVKWNVGNLAAPSAQEMGMRSGVDIVAGVGGLNIYGVDAAVSREDFHGVIDRGAGECRVLRSPRRWLRESAHRVRRGLSCGPRWRFQASRG